MTMGSSGLRKLHQLHLKMRGVQEKLERGPRQLKARRQTLEKRTAELEAHIAQLKQMRVAADQRNLQLKTAETKLKNLQKKFDEATSGKEYDILRSQIDADTMAKSVLEDEILEMLEKVDVAKAMQGKLEAELETTRKEAEQLAKDVAAAEPPLRDEAASIEAALRDAESELPGNIVELYRRLVQSHGAEALSAVESNACTTCYGVISSQDAVNIKNGKFVFCRSCGRLLYPNDSAD
ncbi:MAG: hypothetical protein IT428_03950 [Planctomycetaceae bacterium]|nr:hypothetical protein [Planctomycetaceae bacterium]